MKFEQVEKKIARPPAAHNVARLLDPNSELKTTENIANFAVSIPAFNYRCAEVVIRDRVSLGLELETALKTVRTKGAPAGRAQNEALVRAFYEHDKLRNYSAAKPIESYRGQFRISREISVPTVPTFTILEGGCQVPIVVCGWKKFSLRRAQVQVWLSMLDSGLFSFVDYMDSPWEVVLLAEQETPNGKVRTPRTIRRGEYSLLSSSDLAELAAMYSRAQKEAMPLAREIWERREQSRRERAEEPREIPVSGEILDQPDMFASISNSDEDT